MKKFIKYLMIWMILFIVEMVMIFNLPTINNVSVVIENFWLTFLFLIIVFGGNLIIMYVLFKSNTDNNKTFLYMPLFVFSIISLIIFSIIAINMVLNVNINNSFLFLLYTVFISIFTVVFLILFYTVGYIKKIDEKNKMRGDTNGNI